MKSSRSGGYLISKINHITGRIFNKFLREHNIDINRAQGKIMFTLWKKDNINIKELGKETALTKSTMTPMLDRLEKMGYIKRILSRTDRREILINLTEKDNLMQETYSIVSQKMGKIFYKDFTEQEKDDFEKYLERILSNLIAFESY